MPSRRSLLAGLGAGAIASTAGCVVVDSPSRRGTWSAPGHSDARTSRSNVSGPTGHLYPAWSTDIREAQPTTPVVADGTVYLLVSDTVARTPRRASLVAYDAASGARRWETTLWETDTESPLSVLHVDALRFYEGVLYAQTFGGVHAVSSTDGDELWSAPLPVTDQPFPRVAAPVVQADTLVAGAYGEREDGPELRGYHPTTGQQRWRTRLPAMADLWTLTAGRGTVFAPFLGDGETGRGLVAVDAADGTVQWSRSLPVDGPVTVLPDRLVVPLREDGVDAVAVVDRADRTVTWRRPAVRRTDAGLAVARDRVLYVDDDALVARRLDTGEVVWSFGTDARRVRLAWTPVVAGVVYALAEERRGDRSPNVLFAVDLETGSVVGSGTVNTGTGARTLAVVDGAAYLTLGRGELRCYESCARAAFDRCVLG